MANVSTIIDYVKSITQLPSGKFTEAAYSGYIDNALHLLSSDSPRLAVQQVIMDGSILIPVSGLTSWQSGLSVITAVEYPIASGVTQPSYLDYSSYTSENGDQILLTTAPTSGEIARVHYSAEYTNTSGVADIPNGFIWPLVWLTASIVFKSAAAIYTPSISASLGTDNINWDQKPEIYLKLSTEFENKYRMALGLPTVEQLAQSSTLSYYVGEHVSDNPEQFGGRSTRFD